MFAVLSDRIRPQSNQGVAKFRGVQNRMLSNLTTENLARASARKPKRVLLVWLLVLVGSMMAAATLLADGTTPVQVPQGR